MAGKGGGAWKVAYADFVTAMMAFFMVMWIVAQGKPVKEAIAQYFNDPFATSTRPGSDSLIPSNMGGGSNTPQIHPKGGRDKGRGSGDPGDKPDRTDDPDGKNIKRPSLFVLHNGERSTMGTMVLFPEDTATLDDTARRGLSELAPSLVGKPNKIEIRGHSTARPMPEDSPFAGSWHLSYARCQAVMEFLEEKGVESERFRMSQAGPHEPHTLRVEPEWQAKNSRVEVYVLGEFVSDLKGTRDERADRFDAANEAPAGGH